MNAFKYLLIISLISWNCSEAGEPELLVEDVEASYKIEVKGGIQDFTIEGTDARWRPDIGHMSLGPENNGCDVPVASFNMDLDPKVINVDGDSLKIESSDGQLFGFWSILYPCNDLGDQESNLYTAVSVGPFGWTYIGGDSRGFGLTFIRGNFSVIFTRTIVNDADVPEEIQVTVDFTAVE